MTQNAFRITVDEPNFSRVLKEPVELEKIRNLPNALRSMETARVWAIKPGQSNEDVYKELKPEDRLLFYLGKKHRARDEGLYVAVGRVGKKFRGDEDSAREFFRNIHAVRMFTVKDFRIISKTHNDIERILGYKGHPEGSHRIHERNYASLDGLMNKLSS